MTDNLIKLGVNIDHVATLRQARGGVDPEPLQAAHIALGNGADSITVHLREDRRHIQDHDVIALRKVDGLILNLEMAATDEMVAIAEKIKPDYCCIVPEKREELTTEGGLDVVSARSKITSACNRLHDSGIIVSLFIDADEKQIDAASEVTATVIEIHTGHYANAAAGNERKLELEKIGRAIKQATALGIQVNAGHGLNYENVQAVVSFSEIVELNIGHSIIARSIIIGLDKAVDEMKALMLECSSQ